MADDDWEALSLRGRIALLPREARLLLVGIALFSLGNGLTMPYLFVYLHDVRSIGTATVGLVISWMALVSLAAAPLWGTLADREGPRLALLGSLIVEVTGVASLVLIRGPASAVASTTVVALGMAGVWPAQSALLARLVPSRRRTWMFGLWFMLLNLGIGLGGLLAATFIDVDRPATFQALYLVNALGYLAYVGVLLLTPATTGRAAVPEPDQDEATAAPPDGGGYREVLRDVTFLQLVATAVTLLVFGYAQLQVGLTAYVTEVAGVPARWLGVAFAANTATIVVAQLLVIRRLEGRSRSRALAAVGVLWGCSWLVLTAVGAAGSTALAVGVVAMSTTVFAVGETVWSPTFPALVNHLAPDRLRGRYNAVSGVAWNVGNVLGPIYAGLLIGSGAGAWWPVVTAVGCLLASVLALRLRHRLTPAQDGREAAGATMAP